MDILEKLFSLRDEEYAAFQAKLTPTVAPEKFIGVRVPEVRRLAKEIYKEGKYQDFISALPHEYYDENMLHGLIISEIKDYDESIKELEKFLPYVDNWAVCDTMSPKPFKKNRDRLIEQIKIWADSENVYTCRFGIEMLMAHFLNEDFRPEYLEIPAKIHSEEYYINMMTAWYFATALAKQWDAAFPYIKENRLDTWVHNKTIQKARESYRITAEQKEILKALKRV
ncbi:MAG: DNA alkylation repair protein [Clostridia bacterium]|nr:DNA alkylation repair protein [Clostridia bacterium]